jgi:hypothetical protein
MLRVRDFNRNRIIQFVFLTLLIFQLLTSLAKAASFTQGNILIYTKDRIYEYSMSGVRVQKISVPSLRFSQHGITMISNNRVAINDINKLHLYDSKKDLWSSIASSNVDAGLNSGDGKIAAYCNFILSGDSLGSSKGIIRYDVLQNNYYRDQSLITSNISIGLDGFFYIGLNKFDPVTLENIGSANFSSPPNNIIDRVANKLGTQFVISSSPYHAIYRVSKSGVREAVLYTGYYRIKDLIDIDINDAGKVVVGNKDGQVLITDESFKSLRIIDLSSDENSIPAYVAFVSSVQGFNANKLAATVSNSEFLNGETCTKLQAGKVSQYLNRNAAIVSQSDIINYYATLGMDTSVVVDAQNSTVSYYSIDVLNTKFGDSSLITIPLTSVLQTSSKLVRLLMPQGWSDFIVNSTNTIASSRSVNGKCPLAGDNVYISGLNINDSCLQIRIEDGGPNDMDGIQNKHVQLIAGITSISDTDGDGVPDVLDAFPFDPLESKDSDGDGVGDNGDAFPLDPTETKDSDSDGTGDNQDVFPLDPTESKDSDSDGVGDNKDAFPFDPNESKDTDGDGIGDNQDAFPLDPTKTMDTDTDGDGVADSKDAFPLDPKESKDSDADGVGDNQDAFPFDPTETKDTDGDGVGDSNDAFPIDPSETKDSDSDGIGDNKDKFPLDPTETKDSDADGVGDNKDVFPFDPTESKDSDGDGVGDNKDQYPNDSTRSVITLSSYYPQHKDNNWLYSTSNEKAVFTSRRIINKIYIRPLQLTNNLRLYLRSSDAGIGISGVKLAGLDTQSASGIISADMTFDDEIAVLFPRMVTGIVNRNSDRGQINIQPITGYRAMNYQVDSNYIGLETVVVPYGSFRAHRVNLTFNVTTTADVNNAQFNISLSVDLWFGLDTGIIKYQILNKQVSNGAGKNTNQVNPVSNLVTAKVQYASTIQDIVKPIRAPKAGGGASCSLNKNATFDPVFYLLLLISFYYFISRKYLLKQ